MSLDPSLLTRCRLLRGACSSLSRIAAAWVSRTPRSSGSSCAIAPRGREGLDITVADAGAVDGEDFLEASLDRPGDESAWGAIAAGEELGGDGRGLALRQGVYDAPEP